MDWKKKIKDVVMRGANLLRGEGIRGTILKTFLSMYMIGIGDFFCLF